MPLTHYIITRFSILDPSFGGFILNRENRGDAVQKNLFSKERLDYKFDVFEKMTYKSIINQTYKGYVWLIYTSIFLPQEYKDKLEAYSNERVKIIYVANFRHFNYHRSEFLKPLENYTTIRLDDDDGLCETFLEGINKYEGEKDKIVTAPYGVNFTIKNNSIKYGKANYQTNIAAGLTAIGFDIYDAGNHTTADERFSILIDRNIQYFLCCSPFCDSKRVFN